MQHFFMKGIEASDHCKILFEKFSHHRIVCLFCISQGIPYTIVYPGYYGIKVHKVSIPTKRIKKKEGLDKSWCFWL